MLNFYFPCLNLWGVETINLNYMPSCSSHRPVHLLPQVSCIPCWFCSCCLHHLSTRITTCPIMPACLKWTFLCQSFYCWNPYRGGREAQWEGQVWQTKFDSWNPDDREATPQSCLPASPCTLWCMPVHFHPEGMVSWSWFPGSVVSWAPWARALSILQLIWKVFLAGNSWTASVPP